MNKKAILVGASGAVGNNILFQVLENKNYASVLILVRRELRIQHPKLKQLVVDFDQIHQYSAKITGDVVFYCLGTTKQQTPDREVYKKIDHDYTLEIARIAKNNGIKSFHLITAVGANKNSRIFYTRLKGIIEDEIKKIQLDTLHIYRPSLLNTARKNRRLTESAANLLMSLFNPLLIGGLKRYRSIKVETVARAMVRLSLQDKKGVFIHESEEMEKLIHAPFKR